MPPRKKVKTAVEQAGRNKSNGNIQSVTSTSRRNVRGRRGGLKDMPNMPLDVLLEIFGFMHPRDLLNLARTSKPFRAFLLARSAQPLWRATMELVNDLPRCPSYMSEPAYINLLFFSYCHKCVKSNVHTIIFEFSARYCPSCRKEMLISTDDIRSFQKEVLAVTGISHTFFPVLFESYRIHSNTARYHEAEMSIFRARWESLSHDTRARKELVEQNVEKTKLIYEAAREFDLWKENQKARRSEELDQMRVVRFASILDRLRQEGWTEEIDLLTACRRRQLERERFATKPEHLTERGWQKIRDDVVSCMENHKAARLKDERRAVLRSRFALFEKAFKAYRPGRRGPQSDLDPRMMDLAVMPEFRVMLDPPDADIAFLEDEQAMRTKFDAAVLKWRQDRKDELTYMIRQSVNVLESVDPLSLAVAFFACDICGRQNLRYPSIVAHPCAAGVGSNHGLYEDILSESWGSRGRIAPWSPGCLSASTTAVNRLRPILEVCGLDPEKATYQEMENCASRLRRSGSEVSAMFYDEEGCYDRRTSYDIFTCEGAMVYSLKGIGSFFKWECVPVDDLVEAKKLEEDHGRQSMLLDGNRSIHGCDYCDYSQKRYFMPLHLKSEHDIETNLDTVDVHCHLHSDADVRLPDIQLTRHEDGTIEANFATFGWDSDSEDMDVFDIFDMWDPDE